MSVFETRISRLLGCQYPVIQTAMGWVADANLVAASSAAGGFGFLAGATIPAQQMEAEILRVKQLSDKNFGVNFHMYQKNAADIIDMVIDHGVKAVSYSRSPSAAQIQKLKDHQVLCVPTVGLLKHAVKAVELGADAITVQGGEGGGHTGSVATSLLLPQVVDALADKVPVIGAGGFKDGRGLVAALAYGADGIAMGTRFLLTRESPVPQRTKQAYLSCQNPNSIVVSTALDGIPQRMIENQLLSRIQRSGALGRSILAMRTALQYMKMSGDSPFSLLSAARKMVKNDGLSWSQAIFSANAPMMIQKAMVDGLPQQGVLPSGQVAALIDQLPSCAQLIQAIVDEAQAIINDLSLHRSQRPDQ